MKTRLEQLQQLQHRKLESGSDSVLLASLAVLILAVLGFLLLSVWGGMPISNSSTAVWYLAGSLVLALIVFVVGGALTAFLIESLKRSANLIKVSSPVLIRIQQAISQRSLASASAIVIIFLVGVGYFYGATHSGKQLKNLIGNSAGRD